MAKIEVKSEGDEMWKDFTVESANPNIKEMAKIEVKIERDEILNNFVVDAANTYIKEEIIDDLKAELQSSDDDSMEEISDESKSEMERLDGADSIEGLEDDSGECSKAHGDTVPGKYDEEFKRKLVERILPRRGLRQQVTLNEMKMALKKSLVGKKKHWSRLGFSKREARFLAFHYVPKKTSLKDCRLLLKVFFDEPHNHKIRKQRPKTEKKGNPKIAIAFQPHPTSGDFLDHVNRLHIAIQKEILGDQGNHPLKILDSYVDGDVVFICYNEETKSWLKSTIPSVVVRHYQTGAFMKLVTRERPEIPPNFVKIKGLMPDETESYSGEEILKTLSEENSLLKTEEWKVLCVKSADKLPKFKEIILVIDPGSILVMNSLKWYLYYHGKKVKFSAAKKKVVSFRWWGQARARFHEKLYRQNQRGQLAVQQKMSGNNLTGCRQSINTHRGNTRPFYPRGKNPYKLDNRKNVNAKDQREGELLGNQRSYFQVGRAALGFKSFEDNLSTLNRKNEKNSGYSESDTFCSESPREGIGGRRFENNPTKSVKGEETSSQFDESERLISKKPKRFGWVSYEFNKDHQNRKNETSSQFDDSKRHFSEKPNSFAGSSQGYNQDMSDRRHETSSRFDDTQRLFSEKPNRFAGSSQGYNQDMSGRRHETSSRFDDTQRLFSEKPNSFAGSSQGYNQDQDMSSRRHKTSSRFDDSQRLFSEKPNRFAGSSQGYNQDMSGRRHETSSRFDDTQRLFSEKPNSFAGSSQGYNQDMSGRSHETSSRFDDIQRLFSEKPITFAGSSQGYNQGILDRCHKTSSGFDNSDRFCEDTYQREKFQSAYSRYPNRGSWGEQSRSDTQGQGAQDRLQDVVVQDQVFKIEKPENIQCENTFQDQTIYYQ